MRLNPAARVIAVQAGIGATSSVMFFLIKPAAGTSAIMAFLTVILPTMYYAWFQARTFNAARALAHGVIKMVLTVVLMVVCIAMIGIDPVGFFVTFAAMQFGYLARTDSGQTRAPAAKNKTA